MTRRKEIGAIAILVILIGVSIMITLQRQSEAMDMNELKESTLVLYEGPTSLPDATEEDMKNVSENLRELTLMHSRTAHVTLNGQEAYVYETNVNHARSWVENYAPPQSRTPLTYFDFEGKVVIEIAMDDLTIDSVQVSPLAYDIEATIDEEKKTVRFEIEQPDTYTVTFNGAPERALHLFANPLETDKPDVNDPNVIVIGPGEWNIDSIILEDNQTLYLEGGAVVHGIINANYAENVTVQGRGILDGSHLAGWKGQTAYIPLKFDHCKNITLKDILVLNPNAWVVQAFDSQQGLIDGLKIISSRPNGDGISLQSVTDFTVRNAFVRSWDDSLVVKNYAGPSSQILFENNQLWTDFAQSMELGYETNKGYLPGMFMKDIRFEKITVLNNFHKPVISIHNGDDAAISDVVFKDIVVENAMMGEGDGDEMPYLIDMNIAQSSNWSTTKNRGTIDHITMENVSVLDGKFSPSRISGYDETHQVTDVTIKNLNILGESITSFEQGKFEIDGASTSDLEIE